MFAPLHDATFPAGEGFAGRRRRRPLQAYRKEYRDPNKNLPGYKKCPHSLILFVSFFAYFIFKESRKFFAKLFFKKAGSSFAYFSFKKSKHKSAKLSFTTTLRDDHFLISATSCRDLTILLYYILC